MKVRKIIEILGLRVISGGNLIDNQEVDYAFASDLMSDVLTIDGDGILLITGLSNMQALRTAEMSDINVLILARNKKASPEMKALAEENKLILLESEYSMYRISGELYKAGVRPVY